MHFVGGPDTCIKNPRWWTAAILETSKKSLYLGIGLTDRHEIWHHGGAIQHSRRVPRLELFNFKNSKMAATAILKNRKIYYE